MKATIRRMMKQEVAKGRPLVRSELVKRGFRGNTLSEMAKSGIVYRIAHGVYAPSCGSKSEFFDYELAARVMPKGVFTFRSALRLHGLTDDNPQRMTMAIPSGSHRPKTMLPVDFVYMTPVLLQSDVEERSPNGATFKVFTLERTLVECFKARNKIGIGICVAALRDAFSKGVVNHNILWDSMKRCRMTKVMAPYLEGLS